MTRVRSVKSLALAFFRFLDEQKIAYCVVGDSRGFPHVIASDIDIVVEPAAMPALAGRVLTFSAEQGVSLVQCLQHEQNAIYFVLSWSDDGGVPRYLVPDVCGDYYRRGRRFLAAQELLAERRPALDAAGRTRGFIVAAPALDFVYYLLKRIDKQALDDHHGRHLSAQWSEDPVGARRQLLRFWSDPVSVSLLVRAAESGDWSRVRVSLPMLRAQMRRRLPFSLAAAFGEFRRRVLRMWRPTGLMLAILGPDGSGKSSLIENLLPRLQPAFRRVQVMHLRPRLARQSPPSAAVTDPHRLPARGVFASFAKLFYFGVDYILGYLLRLRPMLTRSTLVIFDRYFHDLLADPRRYRYGASPRAARWLGRLIPRPQLWLVLDAPTDIVQARKREVAPAESARQRLAYRQLAQQLENVVVLDAARGLNQVAAEASAAVLTHLARRTERRIKAEIPAADNPVSARVLLFFCRHHIPLLSRIVRVLFNSDLYARVPRSVKLPHPFGIVVHSKAVIGERVTLMQQVTLGGKDAGENVAPVIGDDVSLGAGAKVLGAVRIGHGAIVGANAVVTRDVPARATVVGANRVLRRAANATGAAIAASPRLSGKILPLGTATADLPIEAEREAGRAS